jgi:hypothetical protein
VRLPLFCFTLALDAMPWLAHTFAELMRLSEIPWRWSVVEGAAMPNGSTKWMGRQAPRLSGDGTTQFMEAISLGHPRIRYVARKEWQSKDEMCATAIEELDEPCVVFQIDGDEVWDAEQLRRVVELFEDDPDLMLARFHCRYFVGPNIVTTDAGNPNEWLRAWRFRPGMKWVSHEPPNLAGNVGKSMSRQETADLGFVFDHYAWALPKHVAQKEALYGPKYAGALAGWERLQRHTQFPTRLKPFFPWAAEHVMVDRVFK